MRILSRIAVILMLGAGLGLLAGCSGDDAVPTAAVPTGGDDYAALDLDDPWGGLSVSDEAEAFGDESLEAELLAEDGQLADDPLAADPEVRRLEQMCEGPARPDDPARPRITYVRLRWGMLRGPEDTTAIDRPCDQTDWTGSFRTDAGVVVVKRLLAFERPLDHVIWPRLDRQTVAFVSHTRCGSDGMVLQIIEPPLPPRSDTGGDDPRPVQPNLLHIATPLLTVDIPVAELGGLHRVVDVDDLGNRFEVTGFAPGDIATCPKGFLSGRYRFTAGADRPDSSSDTVRLGNFAGLWMGLDGRIDGFLRGGYGLNDEGERVFVGKVIGRGGHFRARVRGTWEPAGQENEPATFNGEWAGAAGRVEGILGGEALPVADYPGGFFTGRWTALCDEEAETVVLR